MLGDHGEDTQGIAHAGMVGPRNRVKDATLDMMQANSDQSIEDLSLCAPVTEMYEYQND